MISLYLRRLAVSVPAAVLIPHRQKPVRDEMGREYYSFSILLMLPSSLRLMTISSDKTRLSEFPM